MYTHADVRKCTGGPAPSYQRLQVHRGQRHFAGRLHLLYALVNSTKCQGRSDDRKTVDWVREAILDVDGCHGRAFRLKNLD